MPGNAARSVGTQQAIEELLGRELEDTDVYMNDVYPTFAISVRNLRQSRRLGIA